MKRRELLKGIAAAFSCVIGIRAKPTQSYTYTWNVDPPHTDDPKWAGKLRRGKHNHVLCDGKEIGKAILFRTGPDGFVERYKTDSQGRFVIHLNRVVRERVCGNVEYQPDA